MKILHFILGKANPDRSNGVNQVIYGLVKYLTLLGHEVHVVGISKSMTTEFEIAQREYFEVEAFRSFDKGGFNRVKELARQCDLVHMHGIWNLYNVKVGNYCRKNHIPYIVTSHGAYLENNINNSNRFLKNIFNFIFQKKIFDQAIGVHTLTREEESAVLQYCPNAKTFVLPNGIDLSAFEQYYWNEQKDSKVIKIGYIGRLSTEKNLENLIKAISLLPDKFKGSIRLYLIGNTEGKYAKYLNDLTQKMNLVDNIIFLGAKYGEEKKRILVDLDFCIHPSLTEGFSISIIEILALGVPMIITRTSNLTYYYNTNSFIMAEPTANDLCRAIVEMINKRDEWNNFSKRGKELVHEQLNWESIASRLCNKYKELVNKNRV